MATKKGKQTMATKIDTTPFPERTPCGLADWAKGKSTPVEALASAMCAAAALDCGIDPYSANRADCQVIAGALAALPMAPGAISVDKVSEALARLRPPKRNGRPSDRAFLAALFSDTFKAGPWHK